MQLCDSFICNELYVRRVFNENKKSLISFSCEQTMNLLVIIYEKLLKRNEDLFYKKKVLRLRGL